MRGIFVATTLAAAVASAVLKTLKLKTIERGKEEVPPGRQCDILSLKIFQHLFERLSSEHAKVVRVESRMSQT